MKRLWSIFTEDMDHCYYTGSNVVERHHIFYSMGGEKKKPCEEYGYVIPLQICIPMESVLQNMPAPCWIYTSSRSASGTLKRTTVPGKNLREFLEGVGYENHYRTYPSNEEEQSADY